ncbi:uncharacterized protein PSFLO_01422 [Pseudozyma flocculosa]|uniref:DNA polymerase delta subunit 3 n=1 Tax=Pseudozyma flocculosa TaxID=84751 RepID=A0A5C3EY26_9BASI|nr:uncharacterized protein PSFLO_01422 [Pseudozyma flocculosa]
MGKQDADFLQTWVQHDKKVMTYRLMSRERRIHVDEAKQRMQSYYDSCLAKDKDGSRPHATFILIGELKASRRKARLEAADEDVKMDDVERTPQAGESQASTSSGVQASGPSFLSGRMTGTSQGRDLPRRGIVLASEAQLEDAKSSFSRITSSHIYSLQPGPLKDAAILTGIQHELHTTAKYVDTWTQTGRGKDLGVITNGSIKDNYDAKTTKAEAARTTAPAVKAEPVAPKVEPKKEEEKPALSKGGAAKKGGLDWSRAKPKSLTKPVPAPSKDSRKGDSSIVVDDSDDDETTKASSKRKASSRGKNTRRALLGDDSDEDVEVPEDDGESDGDVGKLGYDIDEGDDDDDDVQEVDRDSLANKPKSAKELQAATTSAGKRADAKKKSQAEIDRERKALEDMMDLDDDPNVAAADEPSTAMMQGTADAKDGDGDETQVKAKAKKRVRKQRKVQKKVRRKDERGYTVTEMVDEYESYSSDESDAPAPAPKLKAAPSRSAARSTSSSASTTPAPSAPTSRAASTAPAKKESQASGTAPSAAASGRKGTAAPKKGQQSLNSFFTKKPKESK